MANLELIDVKKTYDKLQVIHGIDLEISDGEFCVLVGPSGCGKSTLLRMIAGLEAITEGKIVIDGKTVNNISAAKRGLAMVFQSYALYPHMSVRQNLAFGLENLKMKKDEIDERIMQAVKLLRIEDYLKRKPGQLSGGQRQRVAIGRALVRDAKVFLFDEPLSNLDAKLRAELRYEIKKLHRDLSNTMIYVTHDQIEAMTLADRISVMKDGLIQQLDTPKQIYNKPANLFVAGFIGSPSMNFLNAKFDKSNQNIIVGKKQIDISKYENINNLTDDQQVVFGIRPENIIIDKNENSILCKVELVEPMGADTVAIGQWNESEVMARLSPESGNTAGKGFDLQVDTSKAVLFDPNSGLRIR